MKKRTLVLASLLAFGASQAQASYLSAIWGAYGQGANLTLEDQSREQWVDNGDGIFGAGDSLQGFLRFDSFNPPDTNANNSLYVTFSQTFGQDFGFVDEGGGLTSYHGSFSAVDLRFYDYTGGTNWGSTGDLTPGVQTAINDIQANGTLAFAAGIVDSDDYFAFQTQALSATTDYVANINVLDTISTSQNLGSFGAGLSITTNMLDVVFNETLTNLFNNNAPGVFGSTSDGYELVVNSGNFNGTCQGDNGDCPGTASNVQGLTNGFLNNANVVLNATPIPEPASLALLGLGLGFLGFKKRKA